MKKILCIVSLFVLCACDFREPPKCWDKGVMEIFWKNFTSDSLKINSIDNIKEIPMRESGDIPKYKQKVNLCKSHVVFGVKKNQKADEIGFEEAMMKMLATATDSERISRECLYVTYYVDTESGRKADYELIKCE